MKKYIFKILYLEICVLNFKMFLKKQRLHNDMIYTDIFNTYYINIKYIYKIQVSNSNLTY